MSENVEPGGCRGGNGPRRPPAEKIDKGAGRVAGGSSSRTLATLGAAVTALVVVVFVNVLADRVFVRADLTAEGRYSLSPASREILQRLKSPLTVTYYVSKSWPRRFMPARRELLDKLREIETAAGGKILLRIVEPSTDSKQRKALADKNIYPQAAQEQVEDEWKLIRFYSGFELTYRAKNSEVIPFLYSPEELEYQLIKGVLKLTRDGLPTVALYYPRPDPMQAEMMRKRGQRPVTGYEWIFHRNALGELFSIRVIDLSKEQPIPDDAAVLILIGPKNFSERRRYEVERYLAGGGTVLLFAAPFAVHNRGGRRIAERITTGLEELTAEAGVSFRPDFVCDKSCDRQRVQLNENGRPVQEADPYFVAVRARTINQDVIFTRRLQGFFMPYVAGMVLREKKAAAAGLKLTVLAKTSEQTWLEPYAELPPDFEPEEFERKRTFRGPLPVMVLLQGRFPFSYAGKPIPPWPDAKKSDEEDGAKRPVETAKAPPAKEGNLLICSSPDMLKSLLFRGQRKQQYFLSNVLPFMQNATEAFSLGDELMRIRTKGYEAREINRYAGEKHKTKRNLIKALLVLGASLLTAAAGLLRWLVRQRTQTRHERSFSATIGPSSFSP